MDQFGHTLDALKTTASKAICLCETLQTQNKAQAERIAELEKALADCVEALAFIEERTATRTNPPTLANARAILSKGKA